MNSNKFNFYKNAKYFLVASLLLLIAGLVVGLVVGLNLVEALGGSVIVYFAGITLLSMIFVFIYFMIRYDAVTAFCFSLAIFLNVALVIAICAIIRVPVSSAFISVLAVAMILTIVLNMFIFAKIKKRKEEKTQRAELVNQVIKSSLLSILIVVVACLFVSLAVLIIIDYEILSFVRPMLVALLVCAFTTVFITAPIWGFFYKDKPKRIKAKESDVTVYNEPDKEPVLED